MKKNWLRFLFSAIALALSAGTFSGCVLPENKITVNFYDENNTLFTTKEIGLHTNTIAPELTHVYVGHKFMGWGYEQNQATSSFHARDILYYYKAKPHAEKDVVNCYAVYKEMEELCIGYDGRISNSGLTSEIVDKFKVALNSYIKNDCGYSDVTIRYKDYSKDSKGSDVTDTAIIGSTIKKENIADILLGFGVNIDQNPGGQVTLLDKDANISMGGKSRYIGRRNSFDLTMLAYNWILTSPDAKEALAAPKCGKNFTIGWHTVTSTSGLTQTIINNFSNELDKYLKANSIEVPIVLRGYSGTAAEIGTAINSDGDCDLLVGFGPNINLESGSNVKCIHMKNVQINGKSRYICQTSNYVASDLAYTWAISTGLDYLLPPDKNSVIIGWDARNSLSGLTTTKAENMKSELEVYLGTCGYDNPTITLRGYTDANATDLGNSIRSDGDCDVLVGFGSNINLSTGSNISTIHMKLVRIGTKDRYMCQLTEYQISATVYNWLIGEDGLASLA